MSLLINSFLVLYVLSLVVSSALLLLVYLCDSPEAFKKFHISIDERKLSLWTLVLTPLLNTFFMILLIKQMELSYEIYFKRMPTQNDFIRILLGVVLIGFLIFRRLL